MRFMIFFAVLPLAVGGALAKSPAASSAFKMPGMAETCADPAPLHQARRDGKAKVSKLTELPPANVYLSVLRAVDGCHVPVVARYGIGSGERGRSR